MFSITVHRMDRCNRPYADTKYMFCPACTSALGYRIIEMLESVANVLPLKCHVCGRAVSKLHDMMAVEYIRESEMA